MKSNTEKKIYIEKLRENIYKLKIKILKPITYNNLKKLKFKNNLLLLKLKIEEDLWNSHKIIINDYNKKLNNLSMDYNTLDVLKNIDNEYNNKIKVLKTQYEKKYKILQNKLEKIELENNSNILMQSEFKANINIKNDIIYRKQNLQLLLYNKIKELEIKKNTLSNLCELELKKITTKYEKKFRLYNCNVQNGGKNIKLLQHCNTYEIINTKDIYIEKYIKYLKILKKLNINNNNSYNAYIKCVMYDDIDVKKHINLLKIKNENFKKTNYNIDEKLIKFKHDTKIKFAKERNSNNINMLEKYYKLELDSLTNLIKYYESIKLHNYDNNTTIVNMLDKNIIKLNNNIDILTKKYLELNYKINTHSLNCIKKINNLKKDKMITLAEKKKLCK